MSNLNMKTMGTLEQKIKQQLESGKGIWVELENIARVQNPVAGVKEMKHFFCGCKKSHGTQFTLENVNYYLNTLSDFNPKVFAANFPEDAGKEIILN